MSKINNTGTLSPELLNYIPGNVYWKDRNGKFLGCNKEALLILHLSKQAEIVGKTDYDFAPKELADAIIAIDQEIMASGVTRIIEEVGVNASGSKAIYLTKKTPLFDSNGNVTGLLGVSVDITDRKLAEEETINKHKQKEITLESVIALMPGNIYWTDKNGVYLGCNDNQLRSLGLKSRDEFIGKTYIDNLQDGSVDKIIETNRKVIESGVAIVEEEVGTDIHKNKAIYLTSKVPLRDSL